LHLLGRLTTETCLSRGPLPCRGCDRTCSVGWRPRLGRRCPRSTSWSHLLGRLTAETAEANTTAIAPARSVDGRDLRSRKTPSSAKGSYLLGRLTTETAKRDPMIVPALTNRDVRFTQHELAACLPRRIAPARSVDGRDKNCSRCLHCGRLLGRLT